MNDFRPEYEPWAFERAPDPIADALSDVLRNWDKLPKGDHSPRAVERWLNFHIGPAIQRARASLSP